MDISNRNIHSQAVAPGVHHPAAGTAGPGRRGTDGPGKWARVGIVAAVASVVVLLVAIAVLAGTGGTKPENKYVDNSKLQAVFLNTGQVYFGNVKSLNSKYLVLTNIYYLQTQNSGNANASSNSNTNVSLVKLGCELHEPFDQMVINRDQITFWENLQNNGQVGKAVKAFKEKYPNGQKCSDQSSSASTNSGNSAQNAGTANSNANTNNSTNNTAR